MTDAEYLLALRAPTAGHLSVLISELASALQDPGFSKHHRLLVAELLTRTQVNPNVAKAASERMQRFVAELSEQEVTESLFEFSVDLPAVR
jgi:hypothetical protein